MRLRVGERTLSAACPEGSGALLSAAGMVEGVVQDAAGGFGASKTQRAHCTARNSRSVRITDPAVRTERSFADVQ